MRSRTVTVWYCGHCSKRKFTRPAMEKHELSCTMNPDRVCKMCKMAGLEQKPVKELVALVPVFEFDKEEQDNGKHLREATGNCPACILAALRQHTDHGGCVEFNWKEESKAWIGTYSKPLDRAGYDY